MRIQRQWADEREIFDFVADALENATQHDADIFASLHEDAYGDRGSIAIEMNGRHFTLSLNEED